MTLMLKNAYKQHLSYTPQRETYLDNHVGEISSKEMREEIYRDKENEKYTKRRER